MKKTLLIIAGILYALIIQAQISQISQRQTITGVVTDEYREGLPGCTVRLYHGRTNTAAHTDIDGNYTLTFSAEPNVRMSLEFTYVGMQTQRVYVDNRSKEYNVVMREGYYSYNRFLTYPNGYKILDANVVKNIRGRLVYPNQNPGAGITVSIPSRNISTSTDVEGYFYMNNVLDNDIIVDGSGGKYMVIELTYSVSSTSPAPVFSHLTNGLTDGIGVAYMNDDMLPSDRYVPLNKIKEIRKTNTGNTYELVEAKGYNTRSGYKLNYTSTVDISTVARLPKLQSTYAQGRGGAWSGADNQEMFSWGPAISNLEFDGIAYPYDKNGGLVPMGMGKGVDAKSYDPTDFFRVGVSFSNNISVRFPTFNKGVTAISFGQKKNNSPIPNAYSESYNASVVMKQIAIGRFVNEGGFLFNSKYAKLPQQGANLSTLMYSILSTPPTFDNGNGLSRSKAVKNSESWKLADGSTRSYAPGYAYNPYQLVDQLNDRAKDDNIMAYAKTSIRYSDFETKASMSYSKEWETAHGGTPGNTAQISRSSNKKEHISDFLTDIETEWKVKSYKPDIVLKAYYGFKHSTDKLNSTDYWNTGFIHNENIVNRKVMRNAHDIKYGTVISDKDNYKFELFNKHYFSNTAQSSGYTNLFPEIGAHWDMEEFFSDKFDVYDRDWRVYGSVKRSIGESSLINKNAAVLSTLHRAADFYNYFEYDDAFIYKGLKPETYLKSEFGIKYNTPNNHIETEFNMFHYNTHNFILPALQGGLGLPDSKLENAGRLRNYGYYLSFKYSKNGYSENEVDFDIVFNFSQTRHKVSAVYGNHAYRPMAGFSDITTVFAKNQPLGVIYGTTYQRNDKGQMIIGADGFPLVDNDLKKIGDPTPDFLMTLNPSFRYKKFDLSFIVEYSHGGERWNGTQAMLDYHGVSKNSASNRNIKQYIYDGVDVAGNRNMIPVDFYNPSNPISQNRFVRYGATGVGEDYIQKASYFRLRDVMLSYSIFHNKRDQFFKSMTLIASAQNLLLISPYKGVDPSSTLFGYSAGKGLDMFNIPATRNYLFTLTLEL